MKRITTLLFALGVVSVSFAQNAEVSKTNPYIQNFDGMGILPTADLPTGWKIKADTDAASVRKVGEYTSAGTKTEAIGGNNLTTGAAIYNFGAGIENEATDRALGFRGANGIVRNGNIFLKIKNTGNESIEELFLAYDIERYRKGYTSIAFQLHYSADGITWLNAGSSFYNAFGDKSLPENTSQPIAIVPDSTVRVSGKLYGENNEPVSLAPDQELYLAWNYGAVGSGTNHTPALGIDNVLIGDYSTLPLQFTSFTTKLSGLSDKHALLTWTTAQELNTDNFEIQRASNLSDFEKIGVLAAANSDGKHSYSFTDSQPFPGVSYYRIKQVDKDGKYTYSEIKSVTNDNIELAIYPNPASDAISINVPQTLKSGRIVLYNSNGEAVLLKDNISSSVQLDISKLIPGFYIIEISNKGIREAVRFLKQ